MERLIQTLAYCICRRTMPSIITYHGINKISQENLSFAQLKFQKFPHNAPLINERHAIVQIQNPPIHSLKLIRKSANLTCTKLTL